MHLHVLGVNEKLSIMRTFFLKSPVLKKKPRLNMPLKLTILVTTDQRVTDTAT